MILARVSAPIFERRSTVRSLFAFTNAPVQGTPSESVTSGPPPDSRRKRGLSIAIPITLSFFTDPFPICATRFPSAASFISPLTPSSSIVMVAPTISRWLNSSVAISISRSYLSGYARLHPNACTKYCIAAFNSPFPPPNCSRSILAKRGSGRETLASNCKSLMCWNMLVLSKSSDNAND
jgi:hypothetical protein